MSEPVSSLVGAALALIGALFFLASVLGLLRLPDFYTRAHAPAKAATLGVLLAAVGTAVRDAADGGLWLERTLLIVFVFVLFNQNQEKRNRESREWLMSLTQEQKREDVVKIKASCEG